MAPPDDIPGPLQAGIDKLSAPLKTLLMGKVVPYIIQHRPGEDNYVTIEDLADRWDSTWEDSMGHSYMPSGKTFPSALLPVRMLDSLGNWSDA